jgi:O-antigen ligase/tetratricopeptide (TPR) repeat protein
MTAASALFWIAGFVLSAVMGPTLRIWTWGPTILCFAAATAFAIPNIWRDGMGKFNLYILITGVATATWFAGRAWFSPAEELALIDLTLVAMAVSTFIVLQNAFRSNSAQAIIITGIALLLCTNLAVMAVQMKDISYNLLIPHKILAWPIGLFRHYSHCAAFLIASSLLLGGFSLKSSWLLLARITLLIIAVIGLAAVFITKSRSGMIGASGGFLALIIYWLFISKRDDHKWSGVALVAAPLFVLGLIAISLSTLETVQQIRHGSGDLVNMMDNSIRLYLYGIALSCIMLHPLIGGGSRSFSWENYQFWSHEEIGASVADAEHVHNEYVQAFTDYGIIGAGLLTAFIGGILILCTFRSLVQGGWTKYALAEAWRIGGIAAFIGIFIQSNFEGILRTAPGAILLAICLAAASHDRIPEISKSSKHLWPRRLALTAFSLLAICLLGFYGWKGSMVSKDLWTTTFAKSPISTEQKITNYTRALGHWKLESLFSQRGLLYHDLATQLTDKKQSAENLELAVQDFKEAHLLHPFTPLHPRNAANALSGLNRVNEASAYYEKAIQLQGGFEAAYKSRLLYAQHLFKSGATQIHTGNPVLGIKHLNQANEYLNTFPGYLHGTPYYSLKKELTLSMAIAYEDQKQFQLALETYDLASRVHVDPDANCLAGFMLTEIGDSALADQRPTDALRLFLEAEKRLQQSAQSDLITHEDLNIILEHLRKKIISLKTEQHNPSKEIPLK